MNRSQISIITISSVALLLPFGLVYSSLAQTPPQGGPDGRPPGRGRKGPGGPGGPGRMGATPTAPMALKPLVKPLVNRKGDDPFRIPWYLPPPPPYVFEKILPVRVADPDVEPPPKVQQTVREEPALRVSGIMTGDGVFAILEQTGKDNVSIVKPGSTVDIGVGGSSRTYTVMSIQDDTVTLESREGLITYQQVVPLSDVPVGSTPSSFGVGGSRGFGPGGPGAGAPGSFGPGKRGAGPGGGPIPGGGPAGIGK